MNILQSLEFESEGIQERERERESSVYNVYVEQPLKECSILFVEQIHKVIFQKLTM